MFLHLCAIENGVSRAYGFKEYIQAMNYYSVYNVLHKYIYNNDTLS